MRHPRFSWIVILLCFVTSLCAACIPLDGGTTSVQGDVLGEEFSGFSGVAEEVGQGRYIITLTNSSFYTCTSTPSGSYLQVTWEVSDGIGSYPASGNVTFTRLEGSVAPSEPATSGSVTVADIDEVGGSISGSIVASSTSSSVSGDFDVEICP